MMLTDVWFHLILFAGSVVWSSLAVADKGILKRLIWWMLSVGANVSLLYGMATLVSEYYSTAINDFIYDVQPFPYARLGPLAMLVLNVIILIYITMDELLIQTKKVMIHE